MNKCIGCGSILQTNDINDIGYTKDINNKLCERCFRIKHYNEYKLVSKSNQDYIDILTNIGKTNSLVVLVVDLFNIPKELTGLNQLLHNNILLVLTKRDILPKSTYDLKYINYFRKYNLNIIDTVIISSNKNYNFDLLMESINKYKTNKNVYIVGYTNAGKSTMINKILYNYTDISPSITTSILPSTTIDSIEINIDETLTLVDTPGLLEHNSMINVVDSSTLKRIVPSKEIKPGTYQINAPQTIFVDNLLRIDVNNKNSLTFYMSNALKIDRIYKESTKLKDLVRHDVSVEDNTDIVITGLGFIKCVNKDSITVYTLPNVDVYTRDALI